MSFPIPVGTYFACQNHTDKQIRFVPTSMSRTCQDACNADEVCHFTTTQLIPPLCKGAGFTSFNNKLSYYNCDTTQ